MDILVIVSQAFLYICFAFLMGGFIVSIVPSDHRPAVAIPTRLYRLSAGAIPVLTFIPVLDIILYISPRLGFFEAFKIVLTTYSMGHAWDFTLLFSILLILFINRKIDVQQPKKSAYITAILFTMAIMVTVGWASHAAAVSVIAGIVNDVIHLIAVSTWVGIVLIVAWFSTNMANWLAFLKWFSIVAASCLALTAISGLFLMNILVDHYIDGWIVSYGSGLLMKHLFLLPLLFYALFNSLIVKFMLAKDPTYNVRKGVRVESMILLTIFLLTAAFSQQPPPHGFAVTENMVSPLFRLFNDSPITVNSYIGFAFEMHSLLFFFIALLLSLLAMGLVFVKKLPSYVLFIISACAIFSVFSLIMSIIDIRSF